MLPLYLERNGIIIYYLLNISSSLNSSSENITGTSYVANGKHFNCFFYLYYTMLGLPPFAVFNVTVSSATVVDTGPPSDVISDMTLEGCKF